MAVADGYLSFLVDIQIVRGAGNGILFFWSYVFFLGLRGVKGYKRGADTYNLNEDYFKEELLSIRLNTDLYRLWKG